MGRGRSKNSENSAHSSVNPWVSLESRSNRFLTIAQQQLSEQKLDKILINDNVSKAKILWCIETIMAHKSLKVSEQYIMLYRIASYFKKS